ncbi:hypothetical protein JTE90_002080 [Oedothorax gibbosus]|uniref:Uncharacterized protein n=1 Tax=Oedothorax gibbosus TaxID=931172 RepID=A0AAV6UFT8_9ARAC|nr:hypothetical protein JTE90_002080 [Oedothorax gibbosus]
MGSFHVEDRLNSALLGNFDVDLHTFYLEAITKELDIRKKQNARDILNALKVVVEAYKMKKTGVENADEKEKSIRFDSSAKRCAYVLKHSACFTSAVARHVLGFATVFPRVFNNAIHQHGHSQATPTFNLCCLGGGPASDAVGFCKVLSAFCGPHSRQKLKLKVTVVDINEDWIETADNVLDTLSGAPWMERIELTLGFVQADLTKPFENEVKKVLGSADVVTMVYFLSAVNRGKDSIESLRMVQEIMKCMQNNGVLFVLDSAKSVHYNQVSSAAESVGNMVQVYSPRIDEFHTLSINSVRKFLHLYRRYFGRYLCLTNCFVSSSAWCKLIPLESKNKTTNVAVCGKLIVLDCNEEYAQKTHVVLLNRSVNCPMSCFQDKHLTMDKSMALNNLPDDKFPLIDKPPSSKNQQEEALSTDKSSTINNLQHKFLSMELSITINNLQEKFWLIDQSVLDVNNLDDSSCIVNEADKIKSEKASKYSINGNKENGCKPLPVERMILDKCSFSNQDEGLVQKNTQRQNVVRLSGKQLRFRAQINRLLTDEFEHFYFKEEIFDEIDYPYDDTFDSLLNEYIHLVPKYFFQTKSKKRRISTEWM